MFLYYIYTYTVVSSEENNLKRIKEMNYDVHKFCAYKLYDPKHMKGDAPVTDYGSYDDEDEECEVIAERSSGGKKTQKKKAKQKQKKRSRRKRKRTKTSDSEYESDPNFNNRKRRKIQQSTSKPKVCLNCNMHGYVFKT